jgi:hypothetical protein
MRTPRPDPVVTANLYCGGLLDDAVTGAILPFQAAAGGEDRCSLWIVRYSRRGEHLKVRVHADDGEAGALRELLAGHVGGWLESVREVPPPTRRVARFDVPAIDPEDEGSVAAADRSLLWTTYRRSAVTLGGSPWLEDDTFAAHAVECLARGFGRVLAARAGAAAGQGTTALIRALVPALGAVGFDPPRAAAYLAYHRDWLLRFFLDEPAKADRTRATFDAQLAGAGATVERIARAVGGAAVVDGGGWEGALARLAEYTGGYQGRAEYQVDPFTRDATFPPLFKVLHGVANQAGVPPLQEAYVHHLVLAAVESAGGVRAADVAEGSAAR